MLTLPIYAVAAFAVFDRPWQIATSIGAAVAVHVVLVFLIPLAAGRSAG